MEHICTQQGIINRLLDRVEDMEKTVNNNNTSLVGSLARIETDLSYVKTSVNNTKSISISVPDLIKLLILIVTVVGGIFGINIFV